MLHGVDIVDAHHHLIDAGGLAYPWIDDRPAVLSALLPNYFDAARRYLLADYRSDVEQSPVSASVACEFGAADGVAEASWVQQCADREGAPNAFIAAVRLESDDLPDVLAHYADLPVVRAVRQPLYWADNPVKRLAARGDFLSDPRWLRGFERVADAGYIWDLLVYDAQLPETHSLVGAFPETTFVLEAAGWPLDLSADGFARWEERLGAMSEYPNVVLKLQGTALIFGTEPNVLGPWVRAAVGIFGADRCMFASHYPVDRLLWDSETLVSVTQGALADLPAAARAAFFGETARQVYRL